MKRRNFITALGTLAFGVWAPDWAIGTNRVQVAVPHNFVSIDHPELLDLPLRKIFFSHIQDPSEYTQWIEISDNKRTFGDPT